MGAFRFPSAALLIALALHGGTAEAASGAAALRARAAIPPAAFAYRRTLEREAQARFGLAAPVALFAAQIHQESGWSPTAHSKYAAGLAQFTEGTARWIALAYPQQLGAAAPLDPDWAIRALVAYDRHLHDRTLPQRGAGALAPCERWAMVLSQYNGGAGWLARDRRLAARNGADPDVWWGAVERYSERASWAFEENRGYPRRILKLHEPLYVKAGWAGEATCSEHAQ